MALSYNNTANRSSIDEREVETLANNLVYLIQNDVDGCEIPLMIVVIGMDPKNMTHSLTRLERVLVNCRNGIRVSESGSVADETKNSLESVVVAMFAQDDEEVISQSIQLLQQLPQKALLSVKDRVVRSMADTTTAQEEDQLLTPGKVEISRLADSVESPSDLSSPGSSTPRSMDL